MKLLSIESSGSVASAAILEDGGVLTEKTGPFKVTHSETLMPLISECFKELNMKPEDVDLIAVSGGPGSFTGLRIGSATAKGLGFALGKDIVHVPTLDAMAYNFEGTEKIVVPLMDARRGQVYTGIYSFEDGKLKVHMEQCAVAAAELIEKINSENDGTEVIFLGDGVEPSKEIIGANARFEYTFAEGDLALQKASSVGRLAFVLADEGKIVKAADEAPEYLRPSQAERVRAEQGL